MRKVQLLENRQADIDSIRETAEAESGDAKSAREAECRCGQRRRIPPIPSRDVVVEVELLEAVEGAGAEPAVQGHGGASRSFP